jgi:superfamily II DNA or RNA helicase
MKLSQGQLRRAVGDAAFQRGLRYHAAGKVLELAARESKRGIVIDASTSGSAGEIYRQHIEIEPYGSGVEIDGQCSCPMLYNCKHVAAACIAWCARDVAIAEPTAMLDWLGRFERAGARAPTQPGEEYVAYILQLVSTSREADARQQLRLEPRLVKLNARTGKPSRGRAFDLYTARHGETQGARGFTREDAEIALLLAGLHVYHAGYVLRGRAGHEAVTLMLDSGRLHFGEPGTPPLRRGDPRKLRLEWTQQSPTLLELGCEVEDDGFVLPCEPPLYVNPHRCEVGELDTAGLSGAQLALIDSAPPLPQAQARAVAASLLSRFRTLPLPPPVDVTLRENRGATPRPVVRLGGVHDGFARRGWLALDFRYGEDLVPAEREPTVSTLQTAEGFISVVRDAAAEIAAHERLRALGLRPAGRDLIPGRPAAGCYVSADEDDPDGASVWGAVLRERPALEAAGWQVEIDPGFPLRFEQAEWIAALGQDDGRTDWFDLSFELRVGDERVPMVEALMPLLRAYGRKLPEIVAVPLGNQRYVEVPLARLQPLLDLLQELFSRGPVGDGQRLRFGAIEAPLIAELAERGLTVQGGARWRELAERLRDFSGLAPVTPPAALAATLRPYQQTGLAWLQFLREFGFNGILADDMGLGKTLQTLAHLVTEQAAGRLDAPALLVAPTSLMGNWRREAARFAPTLRVVVLHGPERHGRYADARDADLVLTTYPLLPRDAERLAGFEFHSLILDEAQHVKNPRAKAALVARTLKARHRLCLTGTPLENHLGELWALFDLLMPGFLGDAETFRQVYRVPIESGHNAARQAALARRVAPFMLRRSKQAVAAELPPKTEIIERIAIEGTQAELYESVRVAVDERVREAIARQGVARSRITVLDALLKLRQVCCDPRLLSVDSATRAAPSAKLERLLELLEELLAEGRRVLVFSQFTSMLALIEEALHARGLRYTKLTGQTKRRDEAVDSFRRGDVDLFLISLKAGGTGLNLPEADTVIHYDPWWNPAAETQATDRAHRIGQTQPVFVYKLIVEHSVEEKMLELQARKRALAQGVHAAAPGADAPLLDQDLLSRLLEPITADAV